MGQHVQSQPEFGREPGLEGSSTQVLRCFHWALEAALPSSCPTAERELAQLPSHSCCRIGPLGKVGRGLEPALVEQGLAQPQSHPALCL